MELWTAWTDLIAHTLSWASQQFGLPEALAIIALTLLVRLCLLPLSYRAAYQAQRNKQQLQQLQPALERLKSRYQDNPAELARRSMVLYRQHNIRFMDKIALANLGGQGLFGLGFTSALAKLALSAPFLWMSNIARADAVLALVVGIMTYLMMWLTPGMAEQGSLMILLLPALFAAGALLFTPAATGLYWFTSNLVGIGQALWLRRAVQREQHVAS